MTEGIRTARHPAIDPRFRLLLLLAAFFALWTGLPAGYSHSSVYSFDWQHELTPAGSIYASAAINHILSDGTLIISAGNPSPPSSSGQVLAYDPKGSLKWSYDTGGYPASVGVSADQGTVYVVMTRDITSTPHTDLYALQAANGLLKWQRTLYPAGVAQPTQAMINLILADGTVLITASGETTGPNSFGKIFAYGPGGSLKWSYDTHGAPQVSVSPDQTTIYGTATKRTPSTYQASLYAIQANGLLKWQHALFPGITTGQSAAAPRILSDGTLIVGAGAASGKIVAYDPSGSLKWAYPTQGPPQVSLSPDRATIYTAVTRTDRPDSRHI